MSTETWEALAKDGKVVLKKWGSYSEMNPEWAEQWANMLLDAADSAKAGANDYHHSVNYPDVEPEGTVEGVRGDHD